MVVTTPDKVLLKVLWDTVLANGRPPHIRFGELAQRLSEMQKAGVVVYATSEVDDLTEALSSDARALERLGFLRVVEGEAAELTPAGELVASTLEYPDWVRNRIEPRPAVDAA